MSKRSFDIPLSPMAGSSVSNIIQILKGQKVSLKYIPKILLTLFYTALISPTRFFDRRKFNPLTTNYKFKKSPLFILGHWRSGTTFLHNVLCQDPEAGYVTTYQSVFPLAMNSQFFLKKFMRILMPNKRPTDNVLMATNFPQEDEFALSNINPYSYYNFMYFPKEYQDFYKKYVKFEIDEATKTIWKEDYIKLIKKALLNTNGERAVLKNPVNTGRIKMLLSLFPDAKFIHIYRNPVVVYLSTKKFFFHLIPSLTYQKIEEEEIIDLIFEVYVQMMNDYFETKSLIPTKNLVELKFEDFEKNPLENLEQIYCDLDLDGFQQVSGKFETYLDSKKSYKKNKYAISQKELNRVLKEWDFTMKKWEYEVPKDLNVKVELS